MDVKIMPIVRGIILGGALATVGCVSVESTQKQLESSNPQEVQKAKETILHIVKYDELPSDVFRGQRDMAFDPSGEAEREAEQVKYVNLVSDNELLFKIIETARRDGVAAAAVKRIDLSKVGVGMEILRKSRRIRGVLIKEKTGPTFYQFMDKVIATLGDREMLDALELKLDGEVRKRIATRFVAASHKPEILRRAIEQWVDLRLGLLLDVDAQRVFVNGISDNELLLRIIEMSEESQVIIEAAAKRIDLSETGVGMKLLKESQGGQKKERRSVLRKIAECMECIKGDGASVAFTEKVLATLNENELTSALKFEYCDKALKERIAHRLIAVSKDIPLLLSFCELEWKYAVREKAILKLAEVPEKLPSSDVVGKILKANIVKDSTLRKGLFAQLSDEETVKIVVDGLEFVGLDESWDRDPSILDAMLVIPSLKDRKQMVKVVLKVFETIASLEERSRIPIGRLYFWGEKDRAKIVALCKRLPKFDDVTLEELICRDTVATEAREYFIDAVSVEGAYQILSRGKASRSADELALIKKLPQNRVDVNLYRGVWSDAAKKAVYKNLSPEARKVIDDEMEKAFTMICEKAKAVENETFTLDGFYLGMSFDDAKVVFSRHFPQFVMSVGADEETMVLEVPWQDSPFCYASVADKKVYQFNFGKKLLKKWYPYDVQTAAEWAYAYGREMKFNMKFKEIQRNETVFMLDESRHQAMFSQETYQYKHNTKEYRITYFGEEKIYTSGDGSVENFIKADVRKRLRHVRGDLGSLRVCIECD